MKTTIDKAPECLNTNDKAMWVLGWNEAVDALKEALAQPDHLPDTGKLVAKEVSLPEQEYLDMVIVSLMREGLDKHRAKEYAQHFFKMAQPEPVLINGLTESETSASMSVMGLSKPEQPAEQEPVAKKWLPRGNFADVASFDKEGVPSFYTRESATKFASGSLSAPCKGKNCGSLNGWMHSIECYAEHESQYTNINDAEEALAQPEQDSTRPCRSCGGAGLRDTGIDEAPTAICKPCDGTGQIAITAQPEQEPVATKTEKGITLHVGWDDLTADTKLYTSPPARKWVGLTDDEIKQALGISKYALSSIVDARAVEAKLKEKNT
jgi:hypothetical protein